MLTYEISLRLIAFLSVFLLMGTWEMLAPRRQLAVMKSRRWANHLVLAAINSWSLRFVLPLSLVGTALFAEAHGWGVLHVLDWPNWLEVLLAIVLFDLAIYLQHVLFHAVPVFWRLHMVHHTDLDFDVTTGIRFHAFEMLLSICIKNAVVLAVGPTALAVLAFEILLNATSMFNHSNVAIPTRFDHWLRCVIVTPDMHRVHHSIVPHETNSNFGFNFPFWDHLLGTYRDQPADGHENMAIGLEGPREERSVNRLIGLLLLPFRSHPAKYPINRRGEKKC